MRGRLSTVRYRVRVAILRDLLAVLLALVATALAALWIPAVWVQHNIVDEQGFLAIVAPLADDARFQRTLTDPAVDQVLGDERVPPIVTDTLTPIAKDQASQLTGTDMYAALWTSAMREFHDAVFTPGASDVQVDLMPAVERILSGAEDALPIRVSLPRPDNATVTLARIPDVPLLPRAAQLAPWAPRLLPGALIAAALSLLVARRRTMMLLLLGIGAIAAGIAVQMLGARISDLVPDSVDQAVFVGPIVQVLEQRFSTGVTDQSVWLFGAGAVLTALGIAVIVIRRLRATPEPA